MMKSVGRCFKSLRSENSLKCRIDFLSTLIIVFGTLLTAFLGVFLQPDRLYYWPWLILAIPTALLLWFLLSCRSHSVKLQQEKGTLYYIRFLDSSMPDTHEKELREAKDQYMDLRTITRSFPPHDALRKATATSPEALDVCTGVADCAHALEQATSSDVLDTSFTYAPNALFPMGLAIGYQTFLMEKSTLVELPGKNGELGSWKLQHETSPEDVFLYLQTGNSANSNQSPKNFSWKKPDGGSNGSPVTLTWCVIPTPSHPSPLPDKWNIPENVDFSLEAELKISKDDPNARHINVLAAACARSLYEVQHAFPNSPVILRARLPKSLQLVIGWRLAQKLDNQQEEWNPWENLITTHFNPGDEWNYSIVRVHPAQPSIDEMLDMLNLGT